MLSRALRISLLLGPSLLMVCWAWLYWVRCVDEFHRVAPSVRVNLVTQGGNLELKAAQLHLSSLLERVSVRGLEVKPEGEPRLAVADRVDFRWNRSGLSAKVSRGRLRLERDAGGQIKILKYLPDPEEDAEPKAIRLSAQSLGVDWIEPGRRPFRFHLAELEAVSWGQTLTARSLVQMPDSAGRATVTLRTDGPRTRFSINSAGLEVVPLFAFFRTLPEAKHLSIPPDWRADRLTATLRLVGEARNDQFRFKATGLVASQGVHIAGLDAESAQFEGVLTEAGAVGVLVASRPGLLARVDGRASWLNRGTAQVKLDVRAASEAAVRRELAPLGLPSLKFQGARFQGSLQADEAGKVALAGRLTGRKVQWNGQQLEEFTTKVVADPKSTAIQVDSATYLGTSIRGAARVWADDGRMEGVLRAPRVDLGRLSKTWGSDELSGMAGLEAILSGTLTQPEVRFRGSGAATIKIAEQIFSFSRFAAYGHYRNGLVKVDRASADGTAGRLLGSGTYELSSGRLTGEVFAPTIRVEDILRDASGTALVQLRLRGTVTDPVLNGRIEIFEGKFLDQSIPVLVGDFRADRRGVEATQLSAWRGATRLSGSVQYTFDGQNLTGSLVGSRLLVSDLLGPEFAGLVEIEELVLSGTLPEPRADLRLTGEGVVVAGVRMDRVRLQGRLRGRQLSVQEATLVAEGGSAKVSGEYNLESETGQFRGTFDGLALETLHPVLPDPLAPEGWLSGTAELELAGAGIVEARVQGRVRDLSQASVFLGSGPWNVLYKPQGWEVSATIGQPERYIELSQLAWNTELATLKGNLVTYGTDLRSLYSLGLPFLSGTAAGETTPLVSPDVLDRLSLLQGNLDGDLAVDGPLENLSIDIRTLIARDLSYSGAPSGVVSVKGSRRDGTWTLSEAKWEGGPGTLVASGEAEEDGQISIAGDIFNFDTTWLALFQPSLARQPGSANVAFLLSGPTREPVLDASLRATFFAPAERGGSAAASATPEQEDPTLLLNLFGIRAENGWITAEGRASYRGLEAGLSARVPWKFPFEFPENETLTARVELPERKLETLGGLLPFLDAERSRGGLSAKVDYRRERGVETVQGFATLTQGAFYMKDLKVGLSQIDFTAEVMDGVTKLQAQGTGSEGGTVALEFGAELPALARALEDDPKSLLDTIVRGSLRLDQFQVAENRGPGGQLSGRVSGQINLDGTLREPRLRTTSPLELAGVDAVAPTQFPEASPAREWPLDPRFDISFRIADGAVPARLRAANASFELRGGGSLVGTLTRPSASATFALVGGSIRLPNARIAVRPGGSARLTARSLSDGGVDARLDVDIEGLTSLSALRFGTYVERYAITLNIRGNMLETGETSITARSEPGDLSQERILAILGQGELLEQLGAVLGNREDDRELQQTLTGYALPFVLDPFTSRLGQALGLEYFGIEYSAVEGATVSIARSLGEGLTAQYRRQLSEQTSQEPFFDLRLTYRPSRGTRFWRNVFLSAGVDRDRPWKLSVEYAGRL